MQSSSSVFGYTLGSHAINLSKILALPVFVGLMFYFNNFSFTCTVYSALHGTYGLLWCLKQVFFLDKNFAKPPSQVVSDMFNISLDVPAFLEHFFFVFIFLSVAGYWVGGIFLIQDTTREEMSKLRIGLSIMIYIFGVFFHFGADIQKFERLKIKSGLITDGFYSLSRNPGHFGEILIYLGFLSLCPFPFALYPTFSMTLALTLSLKVKERSLSRYSEWEQYKNATAMLVPFLF